MVYRVFVEKKPEYAVEARALRDEFIHLLGIRGLTGLRILQRYDVEGIGGELFAQCLPLVFSEPPVDVTYDEMPGADRCLFVEYLPGQFDQRADSAAECIQLISRDIRPAVRTARVYLASGDISEGDWEAVRRYVINPVEAREASPEKPETLRENYAAPTGVETLTGFIHMDAQKRQGFIDEYGLAMDMDDLAFCQKYFQSEKRDPTITEIRMIDTYWSDHCRHTTFLTELTDVDIRDARVRASYALYQALREELGRSEKPVTLMDIGTIGAKALKKRGLLENLDESDEINACSIRIKVEQDGEPQDWLLLFKNETHNHPTEIEPFGGAATCIGGAIRDPLANRGYVYQAMRITGAGDPLTPIERTIPGKLPQRKLVTTAAAGYSSYGNQIGLATGLVREIYHPGYVAKHMELGAVVGAVPEKNVRREQPLAGDIIILLGGRTGRDGCGGATGSSKAHKQESLETCGAEVQKGNAPVERKLQRLFRNPEATLLIKKCNDFGAGGVSVAIGELADGLVVDLDAVPRKYDGLDGTELAISESQERMAVVVAPEDVPRFLSLAAEENLEATPVARVTGKKRLRMRWNDKEIVDVGRDFLNSNGAKKTASARVDGISALRDRAWEGRDFAEKMLSLAADLNHCSQIGLGERFDSSIGAASVLMPFGGKHQLSPAQSMVALLPVDGETGTCSGMAYGYDPYLSEQSPYDGAYLAVIASVSKLAASGFSRADMYLTFQEYFERLREDSLRWGKPLASLLGALQAQIDLGVASIGGKDSMSGSFEDMDVPPTLVSFAVAPGKAAEIISPEWKVAGSALYLLSPEYEGLLPKPESMRAVLDMLRSAIKSGDALSCYALGEGGIADALLHMSLGNGIGCALETDLDVFAARTGSFVLEMRGDAAPKGGERIGATLAEARLSLGGASVALDALRDAWEQKLEPVYPCLQRQDGPEAQKVSSNMAGTAKRAAVSIARPTALIPVFPGTNCEYDTARALQRAGARADIFVIPNQTPQDVAQSVERLAKAVAESQMIVLPGGFSGGDEPEGSAKLIASFFRNPLVADAVTDLLDNRDGLMLGICNGFQALVKLGLLPLGKIAAVTGESPTLTYNAIGRHQNKMVRVRVSSNMSPWLANCAVGDIYTVPVSHGEGRVAMAPELCAALAEKGQIATQYVDLDGNPSMDIRFNPNGGIWAIEGMTSPDGRIFGRMGHTERAGEYLHKNIPDQRNQKLFEAGVAYFK